MDPCCRRSVRGRDFDARALRLRCTSVALLAICRDWTLVSVATNRAPSDTKSPCHSMIVTKPNAAHAFDSKEEAHEQHPYEARGRGSSRFRRRAREALLRQPRL